MKHTILPLVPLIVLGLGGSLRGQGENRKGLNTWLPHSFLEDVRQVRDLGIRTVRIELPREQVEPNRNQFEWTTTDAVMDTARANQIEVLFTLRSVSPWGTHVPAQQDDLYHHASLPKATTDWELLVGTMASRYKGRAVDYEIENEVNAAFGAGSPAEYLDLLQASYRVIKASDPWARVLSSSMACGIASDQRTRLAQDRFRERTDEWLKPIFATRAFDVVSVHDDYFPSGITANGWTFSSYLKHVADLMDGAGGRAKPIWITETGYVSQPTRAGIRTDDGAPDKQALWLTLAYEQARSFRVERIFWLLLWDGNGGLGYFNAMGLMDAQARARPVWRTLAGIDDK